MILDIRIRNFALIKDSFIQFNKGLNIISGETGAGKSIVFEALGVCLGERASKSMIKSGEEHSIIEVRFLNTDLIEEKLKKLGLSNEEESILIRRDLYTNYPSISRVNGFSVTLNDLKILTKDLCDIYGQYEHQLLLNPENYLPLIDSFDDEISSRLIEVQNAFKQYQNIKNELNNLQDKSKNLDNEIDYLDFQINEIENMNLRPSEDDELQEELLRLENFQLINNSIYKTKSLLSGDDYNNGVITNLSEAISYMNKIEEYDDGFLELRKRLESSLYEIEDINMELANFTEDDYDELRLEDINSRLAKIQSLKKKYSLDIDGILDKKLEFQSELDRLKNIEYLINEKTNELEVANSLYMDRANELSNMRKQFAEKIEKRLTIELKELDMLNIRFQIDFKNSSPSSTGIDNVEFLAATNKGSDLLPLRDIISGGEMSRFMLALKKIYADDSDKTLVFDEIDAGLSGKVANAVGNRLSELSKNCQVILISHLPQIIAKADTHFKIEKHDENDETISNVKELDFEERVKELARLLSGEKINDSTLQNARDLLEEKRG
ncbi:MAG: DNA repair protein RecN [Firmicutes bacterium]|nr:DNA repair protein RecN [Bacillota bacterium]